MTLQEEVRKFLQDNPKARERRVRNGVVWAIIQKRHPGYEYLDKEKFKLIYTEILSIGRYIMMVQQHDVELRGEDYNDKKILEQEWKEEHGFQAGHYQRSKKLQKLI